MLLFLQREMMFNLKNVTIMEAMKKYFMDCNLAGRLYHEADEVWDKLKVGTKVELVREADNRYDPNAVMVKRTTNKFASAISLVPKTIPSP